MKVYLESLIACTINHLFSSLYPKKWGKIGNNPKLLSARVRSTSSPPSSFSLLSCPANLLLNSTTPSSACADIFNKWKEADSSGSNFSKFKKIRLATFFLSSSLRLFTEGAAAKTT